MLRVDGSNCSLYLLDCSLLALLVVCCRWVAGGVCGRLVTVVELPSCWLWLLFLLSGRPSFCALSKPPPRGQFLVGDVL